MVNDGPLLGPKGLFTYSMLKSLWLACDVSFQFKLSVIMNLKPVPTSPQEVPRQLHHSVFLPFCRIPALFQVEPPRRWSTLPQGQPSWLPLLSASVCGRYGGCCLWEPQTWARRNLTNIAHWPDNGIATEKWSVVIIGKSWAGTKISENYKIKIKPNNNRCRRRVWCTVDNIVGKLCYALEPWPVWEICLS